MRVILFLFFSFFYLSNISIGQITSPLLQGSPFITNYSNDEYLERGKNWGISQGEDGKMYFANNYGLVAFNGYDWEILAQPNNSSEIRSFAIKNDDIFIGAVSEIGILSRSQKEDYTYRALNHLISDSSFQFNDVRDIIINEEKVFFLTDNGLMVLSNDSIQIYGKGIPFRASAKGIQELIFVANEYGIFRFEDDELEHITTEEQFLGFAMEFVLPIKEDVYLIGTDTKGIFIYNKGKINQWNSATNQFFVKNHLTSATILNKNELIFGSIHEGLIITDYDGEIVNIINEKDGLFDHNILSIYKDRKGNIWTAVDGSFAYIELNLSLIHI